MARQDIMALDRGVFYYCSTVATHHHRRCVLENVRMFSHGFRFRHVYTCRYACALLVCLAKVFVGSLIPFFTVGSYKDGRAGAKNMFKSGPAKISQNSQQATSVGKRKEEKMKHGHNERHSESFGAVSLVKT